MEATLKNLEQEQVSLKKSINSEKDKILPCQHDIRPLNNISRSEKSNYKEFYCKNMMKHLRQK